MTPCYVFSLLLFCLYCITSLTHSLTNGFSVELIHRDSLKSPFYNPSQTQFQRLATAVHRSINRTNRFNKAYVHANTIDPIVIPYPLDGEYLMSYSVGTPPFKLYGIVDTGSNLVWFQCKPCKVCNSQTSPIFDPSNSETYKTLPCFSAQCQSFATSCSQDNTQTCEYTANYGDGSYTHGDLSVDTLTLETTNGSSISFPETVIGCGYNNVVTFKGQNSGIVGLGNGPLSLRTQLGPLIGDKFSYCFVPILSENNFTSKLNFGDSAVVYGDGTVSTPFIQRNGEALYYLTLEALSVGNKRIEFVNPSYGTIETGNILIDSGTTTSRLPNDVYSKVVSAVVDAVKHEPIEDPYKISRLCYQTTSRQLEFPIIIAHFKGADVKLNANNTFILVEYGIACFTFLPTQAYPIYGNLAQQNFLVGYDLQNNVISFKPTDCTKH
ncbi:aspartic proteinase CDR1-like [Lotus japonicus]|uniref:aspartic proteinase CDR1-like n=1 Tax=Lotus japonicus TaxID=34305 RepID=UPI00258FF0A6|nr:aspartic proteinase CDR1-like [Lotus japonicus]